jgi:hypothetical protein
MSCQHPSNAFQQRRPCGACFFLGFNSHGRLLLASCGSVIVQNFFVALFSARRLPSQVPNDILLLVILSLFSLLCCSNFILLAVFVLISILIDCSFHSCCCPCAHCFSRQYSAACSASIVVVVPEFGYQDWIQSCCLIPAIGRVETSVSHRRSTNSEKRDRTWSCCAIRSDIPWLLCF